MAAFIPDNLTGYSTVQTTLGIPDNREVFLINALIPQVSAAIAEKYGRQVLLLTNAANPITETLSGKGGNWLIANHRPLYTPILTGNTTAGSPIVTNVAGGQGSTPTSFLFVGQPVTGVAVPVPPFANNDVNVYIKSIDSGTQVTLTQNCTQTLTATSLYFGINVWEDDLAYYGSVPTSFASTSQLTWGGDFTVRADQIDGSSRSGMILRMNDVWNTLYVRPSGNLSQLIATGLGNIRVQAAVGWATTPPDLEMAVIRVIAKIRNSRLYGDTIGSESKSDAGGSYNYSMAPFRSLINMGLLAGDVAPIIGRYAGTQLGE